MTTLWIGLDDADDENIWSSVNIILLQASNLASFDMSDWPIKLGYLSSVAHATQQTLTKLHIMVAPSDINALAFVRHFTQLCDLTVKILDGDAIDTHSIPRLKLLPLERFHVYAEMDQVRFTQDGGAQAILSYLAGSCCRENCKAIFDLPRGSFALIDPFFNNNTCCVTVISIDATGTGFPTNSAVFKRSRSVDFEGFVPPLAMFAADRIPPAISFMIDLDEHDTSSLLAILDLLARSTTRGVLSLQIRLSGWHKDAGFYWSTQDESEVEYQDEYAPFMVKIIRRVKPLHQRGITLLDQRGQSFQEHFGTLLTNLEAQDGRPNSLSSLHLVSQGISL
jgi:hypothetical protein